MTEFDTSGVSGTVEFKETDDDKTTVTVHMHGTVDGGSYPAHIHSGPITNPGGVVFDLGPFVSSGGTAEGSKTLDMTYDDMINYDGCFVSHDPNDITDYDLVGNIGSNNP